MPDVGTLLALGAGSVTLGRLLHAYLKPRPPQPYEADNLSNETDLNANPFARYVIGKKVITGGTLLWVFNPTNTNGNPSDRLDMVVGISEGQVPAPANDSDGVAFRLWINGILIKMAKDGRSAITTAPSHRPDWANHLTHAEWDDIKGTIRTNAYEPTADSPLRGQIRLWWNGKADGTEGKPLRARVFQRVGPSSNADPTRAETWDAEHTLKGLTWFHIALDLINKLPQNERDALDDSAEKTGIVAVPRFTFEIPNGIDIARELAGTGAWSSASQNPADVFELILKKMTRLEDAHIASLSAAKSRAGASQFRYNGLISFRQSILDLLGGPELVTNGHVAYTTGQVRFLPGQHTSRVGSLTADDILSMHQATQDPPQSRYNAVSMTLTHVTQSESNTPITVPLQVNSTEKTQDDNQEIVEEVRDVAFINDYRQGQQVARVRAKRHSARIRAVVRTWHTTARAGWDVGEVIGITYPPAGLPTRKDFVIEAKAIASDYQLLFTVREHLAADPFVEGADSTYQTFVEGAIPAPYFTDTVPVPTGVSATRTFGADRTLPYQRETDLITVVANDPGPRFTHARLHLSNADEGGGSADHLLTRQVSSAGVAQVVITREVPADDTVWTIKLAFVSPHGKAGAYAPDIELAPPDATQALPAADTPTGLAATPSNETTAVVSWDLPRANYKQTLLDWGPGASVPAADATLPDTATSVTVRGYYYALTGLTASTAYWVRIRHVNQTGQQSAFAHATFETPAAPTASTLAFAAGGTRGISAARSVALPTGDDTLTLPEGTGGAGASPTYTYAVEDTPDALSWLTIDATTRQLSGTPPADASTGLFGFLWKVTSGDHTARLTIRVYVAPAAAEAASTLTFATGGVRGVSAEQGVALPTDTEETDPLTLPAGTGGAGESPTYTYAVEDKDAALSWLTIDASTRQLSGTPTQTAATGLFTFVWKVTSGDHAARITIRVYVAPSTSDLAFATSGVRGVSAQQGTALSTLTLPAAQGGGESPTYTYAVENKDAALSWLTISTTNRQLSGTPPANAATGLFAFTWKATAGAHSVFLTVRVYVAGGTLLTFAAGGTRGVSAARSVALPTGDSVLTLPAGAGGAGTSPTYTYSVEDKDAALSWLTIDTSTRQLSGTPPATAATGLFTFVWKVATGGQATTRTIRVYVAPPAAEAASTLAFAGGGARGVSATRSIPLPGGTNALTLPAGTGGAGASPSYTYSVENKPSALSWLGINTTTRRLSGTPLQSSTVGLHAFTWKVSDGTDTRTLTVWVYLAATGTTAPGAPGATEFPAIEDADRTHSTVTVRWLPPTTFGMQAELEWGTYTDTEPAVFERVNIISGLNSSPYTVENLEPSTEYGFRLRFQVQGGPRSNYRERRKTTAAAPASVIVAPNTPTQAEFPAILASHIRHDRVTIHWTGPTPEGQTAELEWGTGTGSHFVRVGIQPDLTSSPYPVHQLQPSSAYTFRLRFMNQNGTRSNYQERTATTSAAPATAASTITVTTEGNRATVDFDEYALPVGYYATVEFGTTDDQGVYTKVGSQSGALYQSPYTAKDLDSDINTAQIRIKDYLGTTQQTITKTGLSIEADNTAVTSVVFTAYPSFYDQTIAVQWAAPTFTGYMDTQVRWGQVENGTFIEEGSGLTSSQVYLISGLDPNTEYTVKIKHRHQADPHLDGPELA